MKRWCTFLFLACSLAMSMTAAVPEAIKYQAVARDNGGNILANRNIGIRLSILQDSPFGPAVFTETHNVTSNALGILNLEIGKGSAILGDIGSIQWGVGDYFIRIEMDENGGSSYSLVGTSQLVSVPYAFYAEEAGNGSQWQDSVNNIFYSTGKVGVGTEDPKSSLEIYSGSRLGSQIRITGETPTLRFSDTAYAGNGVVIGVAADSNDLIPRSGQGDLVFSNEAYGEGGGFIFGTGVPAKTCVKITDDCRVGIGTDAPVSKLDVMSGDVNVRDIGSGVIMRSPDGNCWRLTVSNAGSPVFTSVNCQTGLSVNGPSNFWGAVASYPFTGNAVDETANTFDGTPSNVTLTADRKGNANSAYLFNAVSGSYVELPAYAQILGSSEEFSVSMWLKYNGPDAGPTPMGLYPDNPSDRFLISVPYHPTENPADIYWDYGNITTGRLNIPIVTFSTWKHFVFTRSKAQSKLEIYIDGVLTGNKVSNVDLVNKNRVFRLGGNGIGTETFNGVIDDVKLFNRALTAAEVLEIYDTEK